MSDGNPAEDLGHPDGLVDGAGIVQSDPLADRAEVDPAETLLAARTGMSADMYRLVGGLRWLGHQAIVVHAVDESIELFVAPSGFGGGALLAEEKEGLLEGAALGQNALERSKIGSAAMLRLGVIVRVPQRGRRARQLHPSPMALDGMAGNQQRTVASRIGTIHFVGVPVVVEAVRLGRLSPVSLEEAVCVVNASCQESGHLCRWAQLTRIAVFGKARVVVIVDRRILEMAWIQQAGAGAAEAIVRDPCDKMTSTYQY
jgi:hypothetical protein